MVLPSCVSPILSSQCPRLLGRRLLSHHGLLCLTPRAGRASRAHPRLPGACSHRRGLGPLPRCLWPGRFPSPQASQRRRCSSWLWSSSGGLSPAQVHTLPACPRTLNHPELGTCPCPRPEAAGLPSGRDPRGPWGKSSVLPLLADQGRFLASSVCLRGSGVWGGPPRPCQP